MLTARIDLKCLLQLIHIAWTSIKNDTYDTFRSTKCYYRVYDELANMLI